MTKKKFLSVIMAVFLGAGIMTGCGNSKAEAKAEYRQMGIAYMEEGDYKAAIEAFDAALSQEVGDVGADELDIAYYRAAALYAYGDVEEAMNAYSAIIELKKDAYEAYYLRGCLYCKQGNAERAKADFASAIEYQDSDYELYIHIYENLAAIGEAEAGEAYLTQALAFKGEDVTNLEYRGQIRYLLGDYETAITDLTAALEKGSTYANLYLAKAYESIGDEDLAEEYLKTYIASAPTDAVALNELGENMLEKGKYAQAVLYFEQGLACETISNKSVLMHNLITAYEYNGNFDKAWEVVQEYVTLFPDDENAQREYIFLKNRQMKTETESEEDDTKQADDTEQ